MKTITNKTLLKQEDKIYQPIEVDGVIYWVDENFVSYSPYYLITSRNIIAKYTIERPVLLKDNRGKIVAQSQPILEGVPVISLDSYVERLMKKYVTYPNSYIWVKQLFKSNPNQYTQKDIEKAIELARKDEYHHVLGLIESYSQKEIFEQINSISVIEIDEQFQILNYE